MVKLEITQCERTESEIVCIASRKSYELPMLINMFDKQFLFIKHLFITCFRKFTNLTSIQLQSFVSRCPGDILLLIPPSVKLLVIQLEQFVWESSY